MRDINLKIMFIISAILRFFVCSMIMNVFVALVTTLVFDFLYYFLRKYNVGYMVMMVMVDYLFISYFSFLEYGDSIESIVISLITFISINLVPYIILVNRIGEDTSTKVLNKHSNVYVDKGIKALEKEDIDLAISEFESAIKSYKKNYLGYMGMCDALTKSDKKHLKKFKYYKKKCIKYAPENLKENIIKKYK